MLTGVETSLNDNLVHRKIGPGNGPAQESADSHDGLSRPSDDRLVISAEARALHEQESADGRTGKLREKDGQENKVAGGEKPKDGENLTDEDRKAVEDLKKRDREVRAHEAAHMAAAGGYALGGPSYDYQVGPDGKQYAVGGEVKIDTSPIPDNPEATIAKAQTIRAAALAPSDPSGADRSVASAAGKMEMEARQQIAEKSPGNETGKTEETGERKEVGATNAEGKAENTGEARGSGEAKDTPATKGDLLNLTA